MGEKNDGENELVQTTEEETEVLAELVSVEMFDTVVVGVNVDEENDGENELVQTAEEEAVVLTELESVKMSDEEIVGVVGDDETLDLSSISAESGERVAIEDCSWLIEDCNRSDKNEPSRSFLSV